MSIGTRIAGADFQRGLGRERLQPVAPDDLDQLGDCPGAGMLVERFATGDGEGIRNNGLDADLVAAGLDRLLDIGGYALFQLGEELVLLGDGQRQQPVEELGHGRQLVLQTALVDDLEAGRVLETLDVPVLDASAPERAVELAKRRFRVCALQIVAFPEQRGVSAAHGGLGIPLAPRDGAQAVETARDGGDEPPFALHVRGYGPEQRRPGLVGAVGPAEALDRLVGAPAGLQQVVDAPLGVPAAEVRVVAAARPSRH